MDWDYISKISGKSGGSFVIPPRPQRHTPKGKAKDNSLLRPPRPPNISCSGFFYFHKGGSGHPSKLSSESNIFLPLTGP